jgi:hypothetical protein
VETSRIIWDDTLSDRKNANFFPFSDNDFETLADKRLQAGRLHLPENTSSTMRLSSEYQTWKHNFGHTNIIDVPLLPIKVPFVDESFTNREACIESGMMMFSQ